MKIVSYMKKTYGIIFSIVFTLLIINALGSNWLTFMSPYYWIISIIVSVVMAIGVVFLFRYIMKHHTTSNLLLWLKLHEKIVLCLIFLVVVIIQLILIWNITQPNGWDVGVLVRIAKQLNMEPVDKINFIYLEEFPNNIILTLFLSKMVAIASFLHANPYILFSVINVAVVDIAGLLLYMTCKKMFHPLCAVFALFAYFILIGFSGWISVLYSDTLSLIFPMLILCLYIHAKQSTRFFTKGILAVCIGFLLMLGYYIKPTNIFIFIAIVLYECILFSINYKKFKVYMLTIICTLCGIVLATSIHSFIVKSTFGTLDKTKEIPMTHFLMMGLNERPLKNGKVIAYGAYNKRDYAITKSETQYKDKEKKNIAVVKQRLSDMGVGKYLVFLKNKANWILGDGTFYWQNEGMFNLKNNSYKTLSPFGKRVRQLYKVGSKTNKILVTFQQGAWFAMLYMIPFAMLRRHKKDGYIFIIQITVTGILVFLLLFEARSRYLINHLPFFILLSTVGIHNLASINRHKDASQVQKVGIMQARTKKFRI